MVLQMLLREAGADVDRGLVRIDPQGVEAPADWSNLGSEETYVGFERSKGFASVEGLVAEQRQRYSPPTELRHNQWSLLGDWQIGPEAAALFEAGGSISYRFHARDLHLVMGPALRHAPVRFRVRLDGEPPGGAHGVDVDEEGHGTADYQRMYQLVRQAGPIDDRLFAVEFEGPGLEAFVFTFG
jgi:hypothetical protein